MEIETKQNLSLLYFFEHQCYSTLPLLAYIIVVKYGLIGGLLKLGFYISDGLS